MNRGLIFTFGLMFSLTSFATMDRYQKNVCEDRAVYITMFAGLAAGIAMITPGLYFLVPKGDYNMKPNCPSESPVSCCDAKLPSQNVTEPPSHCETMTGVTCPPPKVGYCFGATVAAPLTHQSWAMNAGISLTVFGAVGFAVSVGAAVAGCCIGTCGCG